MASRLYGDVPFAMVPEWILFHPELSDRAVRLWGVLARSANADGSLTPSRQKLTQRLKGCSVDSVDRAKRELVKIGALVVIHRVEDDTFEPTTNDYRLIHDPYEADEITGGSRTSAAGSRKPAATGGRTGADEVAAPVRHSKRGTTEVDLETAAAAGAAAQARDITTRHWERCKAMGRPRPVVKRGRAGSDFIAIAKIVERLLDAGWEDAHICEALWATKTGHTLQGMAVELTKNHPPPRGEAEVDGELLYDPKCPDCSGSTWQWDEDAAGMVRCACWQGPRADAA